MKTPEEKYNNDSLYHKMVNVFEGYLHTANFTPSELREMVILACIHYEMRTPARCMVIPDDVTDSINILSNWRKNGQRKNK